MKPVYLDYNATTPIDPEVVEAMLPYLNNHFGNPSSGHLYGQETHAAIERARGQVAELLGCDPAEIIFTSGGTEANNHAIKGVAYANRDRGNHLISSQIEHPAVLNTLRYLESQGFAVTYLPVDRHGRVNPEDVRRSITNQTILITIMHANNEVGTLQPITAIGEIAREKGVYLHTDAAQSVGKVPTKVDELKVDLLTVAAHKFYGPKGVGALYVSKGTRIETYLHGAGHEQGRRAGTENVPYIVALGKAAEVAGGQLAEERQRILELRERLFGKLAKSIDGVVLNGHLTQRLPNTLNVSFVSIEGGSLLAKTPEVAASSGSACNDKCREFSKVLKAMGVSPELGSGSIRFSLGRWTTQEEIDYAVEVIASRVKELRGTNQAIAHAHEQTGLTALASCAG
ncbi:MAG: cysteine desulfurase family protein [Thermincolia bacterium]